MTPDASPLQVSAFITPKAGSSAKECEDSLGVDRRRMKFCVTDGATEAFDSRRWARLLTKRWVRASRPIVSRDAFAEWLPAAGDRLHSRWETKPLPWYAEEKSRAGAFAAFAGLAFQGSGETLLWSAAALGDSCLLRRAASGHLEDVLPDLSGGGFDRHPTLIPSRHSLQAQALDEMQFRAGTAGRGDVFFLLTDAIAAWYLQTLNRDPALADRFDSLAGQSNAAALDALVFDERQRGTLRNDDIAIVRIEYGGAGA